LKIPTYFTGKPVEKRVIKKLFVIDSTVISMFKDILIVEGRPGRTAKAKERSEHM
jgi:hypothetical protein